MNVIRSSTRRACLVTTCALAVGFSAAANAQTVLVDFGNNAAQYRGIPVPNPDPKSHYWNSIQPGLLVPNMIDINNGATTISLGWNSPVGTDSYNGPAGPTDIPPLESNLPLTDIDKDALGDLGVLEAAFDYAASPIQDDTRALFDLEGLDPSKKYSLTFFGSHKYSNDPTTVYSVYSDVNYSALLGSANLDVVDPLDAFAHNRDKVVTINNLSPNAAGLLYVQFQGSTGNLGYLNSMEIIASTSAGMTGDYNSDGKVNAADYTIWRDHLGQTFALPNRDPANTGAISQADFTSWKSHFTGGAGSGSLGVSGVPEPASVGLMLLGAAMLGLRRRPHRA